MVAIEAKMGKKYKQSSMASLLRIFLGVSIAVYLIVMSRIGTEMEEYISYPEAAGNSMLRYLDHGSTDVLRYMTTPTADSYNPCLGLGKDGDMDKLLSDHQYVYVVMSPKAGEASIKPFATQCMEEAGAGQFAAYDNILDRSQHSHRVPAFLARLNAPTIVASYVFDDASLIDLTKSIPRNSLIVYSYRDETDRLRSAIRELSAQSGDCALEKGDCVFDESKFLDLLEALYNAPDPNQIGKSSNKVLTCKAYEGIEHNDPNMVVVNYQQADKMIQLLKKHHCPKLKFKAVSEERPLPKKVWIHHIHPETKFPTKVSIDEWLDAKMGLLEYVLGFRKEASCQGMTGKLQDRLLQCPDRAMRISGKNVPTFPSWLQPPQMARYFSPPNEPQRGGRRRQQMN